LATGKAKKFNNIKKAREGINQYM